MARDQRECAARVRAAFLAAAERSAGDRLRAAARVCRASAALDAGSLLSRRRTSSVARERFLETGFALPFLALLESFKAFWRVFSETAPGLGGGRGTPARRALESPMAMACLVERTPCAPRRIRSISSRTNSPAWVEADLPSRWSRRAWSMAACLGMPWFRKSGDGRPDQSSCERRGMVRMQTFFPSACGESTDW